MMKRIGLIAFLVVTLYWTVTAAQHPVMDKVANKVIRKYQQSSCEQLSKQKSQQQNQSQSPQEQEALKLLQADPQLRAEFINKVAGPIANKMFDCGMIP